MLLREHLQSARLQGGQRTALIAGEHVWSYDAFDDVTERLAAALARRGIAPGDRVALQLSNSPELVFAYYACFKLGAIAVPINNRFATPEIAYALEHAACRALISQRDLFANVNVVRGSSNGLELVVLVDAEADEPGILPFAKLTAEAPQGFDRPNLHPDDVAAILYTSGTTSRPKGVTHTNRSLTATARFHAEWFEWQSDDVVCVIPPMCHILGFATQMLVGIAVAGRLIVLPHADPPTILEAIQRHQATRIAALPVLLQSLANYPEKDRYDLRSLRSICAGGDAVPVALQERFLAAFGVPIFEGCGMTEVIPFTLNRRGQSRAGSIGRACPGMSVRLVDDARNDVAEGGTGEILVRSEAAMIGYWREPIITAATLVDGYVQTGDLGRRDADGYYWFMGRKKEIIIRAGSNISPLEVEEVLYQHPSVRECGVVGVPHPDWGEVVWAYVSLRQPNCTATTLQDFCGQHLAQYKIPERIEFLPDLPKGSTGKVNRRALRERARLTG